ncbi:MAG: 50S ribosomal protein L21, partial [Planctomycetia bacterium]
SFPPGSTIEFDQVLMIGGLADGPKVGQPLLEGAKVVAEVVGTVRGQKIHIRQYRRRKNFRKHKGHRQSYTEVTVTQIVVPS